MAVREAPAPWVQGEQRCPGPPLPASRSSPPFRPSNVRAHLVPAESRLLVLEVRPQVVAAPCALRTLTRRPWLHRGLPKPAARYPGCPKNALREPRVAGRPTATALPRLPQGQGLKWDVKLTANSAIARGSWA